MAANKPLTAQNTIQEWLDHPEGGPILRGFLAQTGSDEASLGPALGLKLQQLVDLSQGQMPQAAVDGLVHAGQRRRDAGARRDRASHCSGPL